MEKSEITRRRFLALGSTSTAWALLASATGCMGSLSNHPNRAYLALPAGEQGHVSLAFSREQNLRELCEQIIPQITDLAWLKPGDSVLLKVACNSGNEHPAVTWPAAVEAVTAFLKARGAGPVFVGDQGGVGNVRLTATGHTSSTRALMRNNGLAQAAERSGAVLDCFDEHTWNGYFAEKPDWQDVWGEPLRMTNVLQRVDHVIYLPRLGNHAIAGYTCGIKNAVGFLRDDSRKTMHQKAATFYEKIAEINYTPILRDKFRFVLTLADKALLNIGPDFGAVYNFNGCVALASKRLVDHDYLASNLLRWLDLQQTSIFDLYSPYPRGVEFINRTFVREVWAKRP